MSPSQGRPPLDNPKSEKLYIRVTPADKKEIMEFSKKKSVSLLGLIKAGMDALKK